MRLENRWLPTRLAEAAALCVLAGCGGGHDGGATEAASATRAVALAAASTPQALSPACTSYYAGLPSFALNAASAVDPISALAKPAKGAVFAEPAYGTCAVRATDHAADGVSGFARNDYSRRQAFNADSSRHLVYALNGSWHLYDANTHKRLATLPNLAGDAEPQWHPTNPELLYHLPINGMGMRLHELNVATGATRVVGDFGARLRARWPDANAAWTRSEGSPSADGRYWCFMVDTAGWQSRGVFTWAPACAASTGR